VESPTGISKAQVNQLLSLLKAEAQKALGREMIFEVGCIPPSREQNSTNLISACFLLSRVDHQQQPHREGVRLDPKCILGDRNGEEGNNSAAGMNHSPYHYFH
jgi:hypothetical protein